MNSYQHEKFDNIDEDMEEKDPSKAGFHNVWVGIANATAQTFSIETHIESSVPDETSAWEIVVGGGGILGVIGLPIFKFVKKSRKLLEKDTVGPKAPENLPGYNYKEFTLNSDESNTSKIVRVTIRKLGETESCWGMDLKKRHGVIITENAGQIEVIPAAGQFFPANRWTPHENCRNPKYPKTFDPRKMAKK